MSGKYFHTELFFQSLVPEILGSAVPRERFANLRRQPLESCHRDPVFLAHGAVIRLADENTTPLAPFVGGAKAYRNGG